MLTAIKAARMSESALAVPGSKLISPLTSNAIWMVSKLKLPPVIAQAVAYAPRPLAKSSAMDAAKGADMMGKPTRSQ